MTTKLLANQFHGILNDPVEGFTVELADESSLYEWKVYIEGPKDTVYEGGVFQLSLSFPKDYPMSPPTLKFISSFWHPNVYTDGKVCMSILHPPGEDAMSGELAQERWLPTQSVTTIVLSLLSLLNDPNCSSPANVDASVEWRKNREAYITKCKKLVEKANREKPAHIKIPHPDTNEEEHKKIVQKWKEMNKELDYEDFYDAHEENEDESEPESDENENEFLESNEEMNSEDEEEEVDKKKNGADKKESKGKSPVLTSDNSENKPIATEQQDSTTTTSTTTTTTTSSSLPTSSSEKVVSSASVSTSTFPSTIPESSSMVPLPASNGTATTTSSTSRVVDNSIIEESSSSSNNNNRNNGGSSSVNNSNLIMNDNTNNNNNIATTPRRNEGKRKKSKSSKKKCIIM